MLRKTILILITLLLVACSNTIVNDNKIVKENMTQTKEPKQYIEDFKNTITYEELIKEIDDINLTPVDLNGDSISEVVLVINEDTYNSSVTIYQLHKNDWIEISKEEYKSTIYNQLYFVEKLQYKNTPKEAFVVGIEEAGASKINREIEVFMYNETNSKMYPTVHFQVDQSIQFSDVVKNNKIKSFNNDGEIIYKFNDGQFIDTEGNRLGEIIDKELAQLVGTTINNYYISDTDSYYTAVEKITEVRESEEYFAGGLCSFYNTFFICDGDHNGGIYNYYIIPKNEVSVSQLSSYFKVPIIINEWENLEESGTTYSAEISINNRTYQLEFDSNSENAKLTLMSLNKN